MRGEWGACLQLGPRQHGDPGVGQIYTAFPTSLSEQADGAAGNVDVLALDPDDLVDAHAGCHHERNGEESC